MVKLVVRKCLIILIVFSTYGQINAQWILQNDGNVDVGTITFADKYCGWVSMGQNKSILRTTDGGNTWFTISTPYMFKQIKFVTTDKGYAINYDNNLYTSTDGGYNWSKVNVALVNGNYVHIYTFGTNCIFITSGKNIFRSNNQGSTWQSNIVASTSSVYYQFIQCISFLNNTTGWAVLDNGQAYKTTDGGATWSLTNFPNALEIYFYNNTVGFITSMDGVKKTTDGGNSWVRINSDGMLFKMRFVDELNGFSIDSKTTDGGLNWSRYSFANLNILEIPNDYDVVDKDNVWVIPYYGGGSKIFKSDSTPAIICTSPKKNDNLFVDYTAKVNWYYSNLPPNSLCHIDYSINGGSNWISIANNIPLKSFTYTFSTDGIPQTNNVLLRIALNDGSIVSKPVTINLVKELRAITIKYPDKNSVFCDGQKTKISCALNYSSSGSFTVKSLYYTDTTKAPFYTKEICEYDVSNLYCNFDPNIAGFCKIIVYEASSPQVRGTTPFFRVLYHPAFSFISPIKYTYLKASSDFTMKLQIQSIRKFKLEYLHSGSKNWTEISEFSIQDSTKRDTITFNWTLPEVNCKIKFRAISSLAADTTTFRVVSKDMYGVFPFAIGNTWFYNSEYYRSYTNPPPSNIITRLIKITEKKMLGDGKYYYRLCFYSKKDNGNSFDYYKSRYLRQEGSTVLEYMPNNTIVSLCDFRTQAVFKQTLGYITRSYNFKTPELDTINIYSQIKSEDTIADSIGFSVFTVTNLMIHNIDWNKLIGTIIDGKISGTVTQNPVLSNEKNDQIPKQFALLQNYPNPFNPTTKIEFDLPSESWIRLEIYNILGQKIETIIDGIKSSGDYKISWNASKYASGIYMYRMEAIPTSSSGKYINIKKMVLSK